MFDIFNLTGWKPDLAMWTSDLACRNNDLAKDHLDHIAFIVVKPD